MRRINLLFAVMFSLPLSVHASGSCEGPHFNDFDFWLGKWEVRSVEGKSAGHNHIEKQYDGCVIIEHYRTPTGPYGTSLNLYDRTTESWHQTWVDKTGLRLTLEGNLQNEEMVMTGTTLDDAGREVKHKISWTPKENGSVIQHWQIIKPDDSAWQTLFKGVYTKIRD